MLFLRARYIRQVYTALNKQYTKFFTYFLIHLAYSIPLHSTSNPLYSTMVATKNTVSARTMRAQRRRVTRKLLQLEDVTTQLADTKSQLADATRQLDEMKRVLARIRHDYDNENRQASIYQVRLHGKTKELTQLKKDYTKVVRRNMAVQSNLNVQLWLKNRYGATVYNGTWSVPESTMTTLVPDWKQCYDLRSCAPRSAPTKANLFDRQVWNKIRTFPMADCINTCGYYITVCGQFQVNAPGSSSPAYSPSSPVYSPDLNEEEENKRCIDVLFEGEDSDSDSDSETEPEPDDDCDGDADSDSETEPEPDEHIEKNRRISTSFEGENEDSDNDGAILIKRTNIRRIFNSDSESDTD